MTSVSPASGGRRQGRRGHGAGLWPMDCGGAGPVGDRTRAGEWRPLESRSTEGRAKFLSPARDRGQPSPSVCARVCVSACVRAAGKGRGECEGPREAAGDSQGSGPAAVPPPSPDCEGAGPPCFPEQLPRTSASQSSAGSATEEPTPPQTQSLADYKVKLTRDNKSTDLRTRARRSQGRWSPLMPGEESLAW